jgi:hypothetical protein
MDDQLGSTRFRALFESALQTYEKQTGITLAKHSLAIQLHSCRSLETITAFLKDQIPVSSDSEGVLRFMTSLKNIISILSTLSTSGAFDWAIGLVRQKKKPLMAFSTSLTDGFWQTFSPENALHAGLAILLLVRVFFTSHVRTLVTPRCLRQKTG